MTDTNTDSRTPAGNVVTGQPNTTTTTRPMRRRASGRDRRHLKPGRPRQVKIRYTEDEYASLADAARMAGLTPTGYAGEAALAAASKVASPSTVPWRLALAELMAARGQVRRFGSNVNQAVRALNALGETPEWLASAIAITERAVTRLDEAAATVATVARADRTSAGRSQLRAAAADAGQSSDTGRSARNMSDQDSGSGLTMAEEHDSRLTYIGRVRRVNGATEEGTA